MPLVFYMIMGLLFVTGNAGAQITKGRILLGGTISYLKGTVENPTNNYSNVPTDQKFFIVSPSAGIVVRENLVTGIQGTFSAQNNTYDNPVQKNKNQTLGGGVFLRKYVPLLKSFYFFGQGTVDYSKSKTTQTYMGRTYSESQGSGVNLSVYPGFAFALTRKFHMEAGLNNLAVIGYSKSESETTDPGTGNITVVNTSFFGFSTSLGSNAAFIIGFRFLL